jgi:hypothetical protein
MTTPEPGDGVDLARDLLRQRQAEKQRAKKAEARRIANAEALRDADPPPPQSATDGGAQPPRRQRRVANTLALVNFLITHAAWRGALRVNLLTETIEVAQTFPPENGNADACLAMRPLREPADILEAMLTFQGNGFPRANKGLVWDALIIVARRHAYHPVRDYLDALRWDGTTRLGRLFRDYFNADVPEQPKDKDHDPTDGKPTDHDRMVSYLEHVSVCFMVSAVARIIRPGCKVDHLPVVVGEQGYNKSEAVRALCPDETWFTDDLSPDLIERDTKESLAGKWIIELAEVPHVRREVERVKAFFSRRTDRYRVAYDRTTQDHPRQCVFLGSSNELELIDRTGNRRFWPFEIVGPIDVAAITEDRDQLWAEAVHSYRAGVPWWLPPKIERIAQDQQEAFAEFDSWLEPLDAWTSEHTKRPTCAPADWKPPPFTLADAMAGASLWVGGFSLCPKTEQNRAANCLRRLGFRRRRRMVKGRRDYLWEKNTNALGS